MTLIDQSKLKSAASLLRAANHPLRNDIMVFIDKKSETPVGAIYQTLKIEQSICSQHLKILRTANLVQTKREGKKILYSLDYENIKRVADIVEKLVA